MTHRTRPRHVLDGRALRRHLADRGLTRDDLAEALGIPAPYLGRLLDGREGVPPGILFSIAEETAMDVRELAREVEP